MPLVFTFIFYLITYVLFLKVPVYSFMHSYMLAGVVSVFSAMLINLRWNISLHMIGLGALTAFLLMVALTKQIDLYPWLLVSILASGIAGTSRLYLGSHSQAQVYGGYLLGAVIMTVCIYLF